MVISHASDSATVIEVRADRPARAAPRHRHHPVAGLAQRPERAHRDVCRPGAGHLLRHRVRRTPAAARPGGPGGLDDHRHLRRRVGAGSAGVARILARLGFPGVQLPVRPADRDLQGPARQGSALRARRQRGAARHPPGPARRRRRAAGRQAVRLVGARARARRGGQPGAEPRPAGRQDRQRGARRDPRRRDADAAVRQDAADRDHAGRPPGLRQDDAGRQAGLLAEGPGAHPAARRRGPPATQRRHPARRRRRAGRRAGVRAGAGQRRRPRRGARLR